MGSEKTATRRRYGADTKAQILAECDVPGASVAKVAMAHGINANVVHRWRQLARESEVAAQAVNAEFVPVALPAQSDPIPVRGLDARVAAVIRVEAVWLSVEPLDMRAGTESALARVVAVFGAARPHTAYLFTNRRANRMKVLVHDGIGVWLAARRLNSGKFVWPRDAATTATLSRTQFDALVLGLPWKNVGEAGVITVL